MSTGEAARGLGGKRGLAFVHFMKTINLLDS